MNNAQKMWETRRVGNQPTNRRCPEIGTFVMVSDGMSLMVGMIAEYQDKLVKIRTRYDRIPPFWVKVEMLVPRGLKRKCRGTPEMYDVSVESAE